MFSLFVWHPQNHCALLPTSLFRLSESNTNPCLPLSGCWGRTFRSHCSCFIHGNSSIPEDYYLVLATYCFLSLCSTILLCGFFELRLQTTLLNCFKACFHTTLDLFYRMGWLFRLKTILSLKARELSPVLALNSPLRSHPAIPGNAEGFINTLTCSLTLISVSECTQSSLTFSCSSWLLAGRRLHSYLSPFQGLNRAKQGPVDFRWITVTSYFGDFQGTDKSTAGHALTGRRIWGQCPGVNLAQYRK